MKLINALFFCTLLVFTVVGESSEKSKTIESKKVTVKEFVMTYKVCSDSIWVEVSYPTTGWVAVGFNPTKMMRGEMVLLINGYSASDGDLFPYSFRKHGLGKIIGTRSWGGVVGIRGSLPFIDGGTLSKPEFASYSTDGKEWIIEGHGVDPDIVIENDPASEFLGIDQQLNRAIEELMKTIDDYKELPIPPVHLNKAK